MRTTIRQDFLRRSMFNQCLQDLRYPRVLHPRIQLPIGIGPGSAFAVEEVALGVKTLTPNKSIPAS